MGDGSCRIQFSLKIPLEHYIHIFALWNVPKNKTGKSIETALTTLFQNRKPITTQSDKGTEFANTTVQQYL